MYLYLLLCVFFFSSIFYILSIRIGAAIKTLTLIFIQSSTIIYKKRRKTIVKIVFSFPQNFGFLWDLIKNMYCVTHFWENCKKIEVTEDPKMHNFLYIFRVIYVFPVLWLHFYYIFTLLKNAFYSARVLNQYFSFFSISQQFFYFSICEFLDFTFSVSFSE